MTVVLATPSLRRQYKLGDIPGIVVTSAYGAARDKGLRRGDLLTSINSKAVEEPAAFFDAVRATNARAGACDLLAEWRDEDNRAAG